MENLPPSVLVQIFSYLDVKEKCRIAKVCKSWQELVREKKLWKNVNFHPCRVDLPTHWRALRRFFTDGVRNLHLRGFVYTSNKTARCLNDDVLVDIGRRCPNLRELCIDEADLTRVDSGNLPATLEVLVLYRCITRPGWFHAGVAKGRLDRLRTLNLKRSRKVCDEDLEDLSFLSNGDKLERLNISHCHRVTRRGFRSLGKLTSVCVLDVSGTYIDDQDFKFICKHLENISILKFEECDFLTLESATPLSELRFITYAYTGAIRRQSDFTLAYLYYRRRIHMELFRSCRRLRRWALNLVIVYSHLCDYI